MKAPPFLQPFLSLARQPAEILERLRRQSVEESEAKKQAQAVMKAYKDLVTNPAYRPVYDDALRALGMNLEALVERSVRCPNCVEFACRVKTLQDVVIDPLEQVWISELRQRSQEKGEEE